MKFQDFLLILEEVTTPAYQYKEIARDFDECGIEYCIVGAIAVGVHNFVRATDDVDILVSKKDHHLIAEMLIGHGYTRRPGSTNNLYYHVGHKKIQVDIIIEGSNKSGFIMPNPKDVRKKIFGVWFLDLKNLIIMKLSTVRLHDKQDVGRLIQNNDLDKTYADNLPEHLKSTYLDLLK